MSICLVLAWKTGLCAKAIDLWLSPLSETLAPPGSIPSRLLLMACTHVFLLEILIWVCCWSGSSSPSSVRRSLSQVASLTASMSVIYSASVEERATVDCLFEHQLTGPPLSIKINPEVDFRLSLWSRSRVGKRGKLIFINLMLVFYNDGGFVLWVWTAF